MSDTNDKPNEDDVLRRMLNTPPKPHEFGETKKDGQAEAGRPSRSSKKQG